MGYDKETKSSAKVEDLVSNLEAKISDEMVFSGWYSLYINRLDDNFAEIGLALVENGYLTYEEWYRRMFQLLHYMLEKHGCDEKGVVEVIEKIWLFKYGRNTRLCDIALSKRKWYVRIVNNNKVVIAFIAIPLLVHFVLFQFGEEYNGYPIFTIAVNYALAVLFVNIMDKYKKHMYTKIPVYLFLSNLVVCAFAVLFSDFRDHVLIEFIRNTIFAGLSFFIAIPMIVLNEDRIRTGFIEEEYKSNPNLY